MNQTQLSKLVQYIESADVALQQARGVLTEMGSNQLSDKMAKSKAINLDFYNNEVDNKKIIEGVFNGQNMIGSDEKEYSVPTNYASKSKLVEGDILKLTIQNDGSFLFKQIKPVERERLKGELVMDEVTGLYSVLVPDSRKFNVLTASITYFKGEVGDQVTILLPKDKPAQWAAVENIIKQEQEDKRETDIDDKGLLDLNQNLSDDLNNDNDLKEDIHNYKKDNNNGITQNAEPETILPFNKDRDNNQQIKESPEERQKINEPINNDLDDKDLQDL